MKTRKKKYNDEFTRKVDDLKNRLDEAEGLPKRPLKFMDELLDLLSFKKKYKSDRPFNEQEFFDILTSGKKEDLDSMLDTVRKVL